MTQSASDPAADHGADPGQTSAAADEVHAARLAELRTELERRGLHGWIVPRADEHQGESVPPGAQRLQWLTGFGGSSGLAVVLPTVAAIFVDGRYTLQVRQEVDPALFTPRHVTDEPLGDWFKAELAQGQIIGFDPWLHTEAQVKRLREDVEAAGGQLQACADSPLDAVWRDRPGPPLAPVVPHPLDYAGVASTAKRDDLAGKLRKRGANAAVLTLPDSIAWLLNVRGGDVEGAPLPLSFAIFYDDGRVDWFVEEAKLTPELPGHLGNGVACLAPGRFLERLQALGKGGAKVLVDPDSAPLHVLERLGEAGAKLLRGRDPCQLPKAIKNPTELSGSRAAHARDGAAVARFLAWLSAEAAARARAGRPVTELEAAERLAAFRAADPLFRGVSFETISAAGPNGAITHYRVTEASSRPLLPDSLYLVDSGGQYLDGTTDITRTVVIGTPEADMRAAFTRVLQGHIALARARFPRGTSGHQLDSLARYPLWLAGLDYDHGTGHGVGSYLSVHEGPQRISKLPQQVPLEPGMVLSNEPGYYRAGAWGIRIENLVAVVESPDPPLDERRMLAFETLTLAPIDRRLIATELLTEAERAWLDAYHARVRAELLPRLDGAAADWLVAATAPL